MIHYLRLIRFKNLFIIALTMCLMRYAILQPQLKMMGMEFQLPFLNFVLLVIATIFITAAGYVINDYFDTQTDMLNHPGTVTVGKAVSRRKAMTIHLILNMIGCLIGIYISFFIRLPFLSFIFLLIPGMLWFYSTTYKRQFLIGNLIVAFLTSLVPLMVLFFEVPMLIREYGTQLIKQHLNLNSLSLWIGGYAVFAFMLTLIREIVKDIEDFEGDNAFGRSTLPILLGNKITLWILDFLILIVIVLLMYILLFFIPDTLSQIYIGVLIILPLLSTVYLLHTAGTTKDFHRVSSLMKIIMFNGVFYSLLVWYIFSYGMI